VLQFSLESCNWFVGFIKDFIHQKKKKKKKKIILIFNFIIIKKILDCKQQALLSFLLVFNLLFLSFSLFV